MRLLGFILMLIPVALQAETDIRNSADNDLLQRFPRSYIVQYQQARAEDYRLVLGGLEKINGVLAPEKERRLSGELQQITYRIPDNHSAEEAYAYFADQLQRLGAERLFSCTGRDCGSSNQWANAIFDYSRLYGVDSTQSFAAYRLSDRFFSLYSVRRGNKRVYLRLESLQSDQLSLTDALQQGDPAFLQGASGVDELIRYMQENTDRKVWLVVSDHGAGRFEEQLQRSQQRAEQLRQQLLESGIAAGRVRILAQGSFVTLQSDQGRVRVYSEAID
ncbi:DUF4892 domain-containing protein [Neptuniibacter halophilus]|uniref:DUF4892 domain-containing protein n=1 Tax=Neptuniibacter halophilus TaxID=651666 RepID=UPI002573A852|nr:DUF4892 domain-containing protein [Neptuniibacter halophilus]